MQRMIGITHVELANEDIDAALRVLRSGRLVQGAMVEEFEAAFAEKMGARYGVAVSSGSAALHLAYLVLLKPGDEVLVPAFTHISTAAMAVVAGARPVFCDIRRDTLTIDLADARRRLTAHTRALVPVHLFGNVCPPDEVAEFARKHDLRVIWDAAQAHGARYRGQPIGGLPELVCYSFYPTKNMTTIEGGMILTDDREIYERCRLLRSHGEARKYLHVTIGLNYRMTDVEAAIGLTQLKRLDENLKRRRANAALLTECLRGLEGMIELPNTPPGAEPAFHQYAIIVEPGRLGYSRDGFANKLRERGIETAVHYPRGLHQQPAFASYPSGKLPVCELVAERILSLPVHPGLDRQQIESVASAVHAIAVEARK